MYTLDIVLARMTRNKIRELASEFTSDWPADFQDYSGKERDHQKLLCVSDHNSLWTGVTVNHLFSMKQNTVCTLDIQREFDVVGEWMSHSPKDSRNIELMDGRSFWSPSSGFTSALLNLMLMLEKLPPDAILKER